MKNKFAILIIFVLSFVYGAAAKAVCPVCTVAVTACVGLSRWLGIDDMITGLWVGGLTVSLILWTIDWLNKKNIQFIFKKIFVWLGYYAVIFVPLYFTGLVGHPYNRIFGIDKLIFGAAIGSILFYAGARTYDYLKMKNNNRAYFPFQKVVMPIAPLLILSIILYFYTCK
jgi:hypothetical protein